MKIEKSLDVGAMSDRRQRLLVAARRLIETGNPDDLSMRKLAAETGTSPATAYSIFGSKAGILVELLQEDRQHFQSEIRRIKTNDPRNRIFRAVSVAASIYRTNPLFHMYMTEQYFSVGGREIRDFIDGRRHSLWLPLVEQFCSVEGSFGLDPDTIMMHLADIYNTALLDWALNKCTVDYLEGELGLGFAIVLRGVSDQPDDAFFGAKIRKYRRLIVSARREKAAAQGAASRATA